MPGLEFERKKDVDVSETDFKVGDILTGQSHMYRTMTYWYKIVRMTKKQLILKRLQVSYPTEYMSNTPGDNCMPVLEYDGGTEKVFAIIPGYPYWLGPRETEEVKASVQKTRDVLVYEDRKEYKEWVSEARILGDSYAPTLERWDGRPGWVNCD